MKYHKSTLKQEVSCGSDIVKKIGKGRFGSLAVTLKRDFPKAWKH